MKKITRLAVILLMAALLSVCAFSAAPGLNLLTGTNDAMTFDDMTSLPTTIASAVLDDSPIAGESGKVIRHYLASPSSSYATVGFKFDPALDRNRPYRISFKAYKWATEGNGVTNTQLWIMKNGTSGWQIAKNIGSFVANKNNWYEHDYIVSTFGTLTNSSTGLTDTNDISTINFEWQYDSVASINVNEKIYFDDVSIIPAYKFTYLDEDGTEIKTGYENTTENTFAPIVLKEEKDKGIIGWSVKNDGTVDETITLNNEDVTLYAVYDNTLQINLSADKTLLTSSGNAANLSTSLWHRNGVNGITVSFSVAEGSNYVTLKDNGDGTASVTAKAEGLAKVLCTASTGESEYIYILCNYQAVELPTVNQTVPTISASEWLYDHTGATFNTTENAWQVVKRTDVVKSDDGNGNIVYYNNGFLSKPGSVDTSTYKYLLFRVKADKTTNFQVAIRVGSTYKYTYPSTAATNGQYVDLYANLNELALQAGGATISQYVLGITNNQNNTVYIKDITLSNIPTYEAQIPEVKSVKVIKKATDISDDAGTADVEAALFSNVSSTVSVAWKSSSDCIAIKNLGDGKATLMAMGDGTATITAYAEDDETVSESFTVTVSGQREKQAVYDIRIFFWGASTTKHSPSPSIGWYGDWGMAASAEENDYVHKLVAYLEEKYYPSKVTYEVYAASTFDNALSSETSTTKDWSSHEAYAIIETAMKELKPNIIVTAMTGNMGSSTSVDVAYNAYKQVYDMMYSYCPDAIIVAQHCGLSCVGRNDQLIARLDEAYSDKIFYDYHVNPTMKLDPNNLAPEYAEIHSGVAAHWGDKGHNLVATTCFNYISPEIPANIEPSYIYIPEKIEITGDTNVDEKGASLQLGIKVTPNDASADVVWSVDNSNLASISNAGLLTPLANGTVVVTAKSAYNDAVKDTHTVVLSNQLDNFTLTYAAGTTDTVTNLPEADEYASGNYTLSDTIPLRDCYTFVGWGLTEDATETVTSVNMVKPTTVYAIWKKTEGFEFEGYYDENAGFIYGFDIESGFHNNVKDSFLYTTCTAGSKVTFKSPKLDITKPAFVTFGLKSAYTDATGTVELTVKFADSSKKFVYPLTSTDYTTYVAELHGNTANVTGVEIFINAIPADNTMYDISLDYIRFTGVNEIDKTNSEFVITNGKIFISSLSYNGFVNLEDAAVLAADTTETYVVSLDSGNSYKLPGASNLYVKSEESGANLIVNKYSENFTTSTVYTTTDEGFEENSDLYALTTYSDSSIRVNDPQGIRAKASVAASLHLNEKITEYGFAVARKDSITNGKISDVILNEDYVNANLVLYGEAFSRSLGIHKVYSRDDETEVFTAVLYNIPKTKAALTTELVFRPYIKLSDGSTLYGAKSEKNVNEIAINIYYCSDADEEVKAYAKELIDICGNPFDNELGVDVEDLYKD